MIFFALFFIFIYFYFRCRAPGGDSWMLGVGGTEGDLSQPEGDVVSPVALSCTSIL